MVENKVNMLKQEGIAEELIQQIVVADVNTYVKTFYNQKDDISLSVYDRLLKIIDADMVEFAQQVVSLVERYIKLVSRERFFICVWFAFKFIIQSHKRKAGFA